jgi:Domain of unknown function (DUF1707)
VAAAAALLVIILVVAVKGHGHAIAHVLHIAGYVLMATAAAGITGVTVLRVRRRARARQVSPQVRAVITDAPARRRAFGQPGPGRWLPGTAGDEGLPGRPRPQIEAPATRGLGWLGIRVSDLDRDAVLDVLQEAYAAGRLSWEEFEERAAAAYASRTWGELCSLAADLPAPPGARTPRRPRRSEWGDR